MWITSCPRMHCKHWDIYYSMNWLPGKYMVQSVMLLLLLLLLLVYYIVCVFSCIEVELSAKIITGLSIMDELGV